MAMIKSIKEWLGGDERMAHRLVEEWKTALDKFLWNSDHYELHTREHWYDWDCEPEVTVLDAELDSSVYAEASISGGEVGALLIVDAYDGDDEIYLYVNGEDVAYTERRELQAYMDRRMGEALTDMYGG